MNSTAKDKYDALFTELRIDLLYSYLPIIIWMMLLAIVGTLGNIITIIFYGKRNKPSSTDIFIRYLAAIDFLVCSVLMWGTIADMFTIVNFASNIGCKFMYFFDHWIVVTSVLILWIISIDRYKKICTPFKKQFTARAAKIIVLVLFGMSLANSVRDFVTIEVIELNLTTFDPKVPDVQGHYCSNSDDNHLEIVILLFHLLDLLMILGVFLTFAYTYGNVLLTVRKQNKKKSQGFKGSAKQQISGADMKQKEQESGDEDLENSDNFSFYNLSMDTSKQDTDPQETSQTDVRISFEGESVDSMGIVLKKSKPDNDQRAADLKITQRIAKRIKKMKVRKSQMNLTIMMFAVSVGYVICFTPYFIVIVIRQVTVTNEEELAPWVQFLLRSPFWNSVVNPVIFCVFNPQYRKYVKSIFGRCLYKQSYCLQQ